jgi:lysyl-tRNA synthetase class II
MKKGKQTTGGDGLQIERLTMLLTEKRCNKDVTLFPAKKKKK